MASSSGSADMAGTVGSESADVSVPSSTSSSRTNADLDTCAYYGLEPGETCFKQRSCYDCLNVPVATDPGAACCRSSATARPWSSTTTRWTTA